MAAPNSYSEFYKTGDTTIEVKDGICYIGCPTDINVNSVHFSMSRDASKYYSFIRLAPKPPIYGKFNLLF